MLADFYIKLDCYTPDFIYGGFGKQSEEVHFDTLEEAILCCKEFIQAINDVPTVKKLTIKYLGKEYSSFSISTAIWCCGYKVYTVN